MDLVLILRQKKPSVEFRVIAQEHGRRSSVLCSGASSAARQVWLVGAIVTICSVIRCPRGTRGRKGLPTSPIMPSWLSEYWYVLFVWFRIQNGASPPVPSGRL